MPPKRRPGPSTIHQIKVTLLEVETPVWRCLHVASDIELFRLHRVLQAAMGWRNAHPHEFRIGGSQGGGSTPERATLADVAPVEGASLLYCYDFGDGWEHEIVVERIAAPVPEQRYPMCLDGARACPPEDCGGPPGYAHLVEALGDPHHPEHDELLDWVGGSFEPDTFDRDAINVRLRARTLR
jgi:hypothetical protein